MAPRISRIFAPSILVAFVAACGGKVIHPGEAGGSGGAGGAGAGGGAVCGAPEPPLPPADVCARVAGGPPGALSPAVDLSAVHGGVRFFGPITSNAAVDQALVAALEPTGALAGPDLAAYAAALGSDVACAVPAASAALGDASVTMSGGTAIVRPGKGSVTIPQGAEAVMIDLRGLPAAPGLREVLEAAVAPALAAPIERPRRRVRTYSGMFDEVFTDTSVYEISVKKVEQASIPASGGVELPLALLTGPVMAPEAVELAATLRLANRAFLLGEDLLAAVAEMRWQGVGNAGIAHRWGDLGWDAATWPDVIPADHRLEHPECVAADLPTLGAPQPVLLGGSARSNVTEVYGFDEKQDLGITRGSARAALVIAHGAVRRFFPYFHVVGDIIDARLDETLAVIGDSPDRLAVRDGLRRFGEAIDDGHNFVFDHDVTPGGYFAVKIEDIDGEAVVRRSLAPGVNPGDTITSIDGVPADLWYQTELARTSAASEGYRFNLATRYYTNLGGTASFGLRDPDGVEKTVTVTPQQLSPLEALMPASNRPAGFLTDLGAPDLYYINLDASVLTKESAMNAAVDESMGAKGLVIDMRGYPTMDFPILVAHLVQVPASSPIFHVPTLDGPDVRTIQEGNWVIDPIAPIYTGPVAFLVGHSTVSAAETVSTLLVDAHRVEVFGRRSAATNGNVTGVQLPGSFAFSFTGMEVLHADAQKSQFHGIGIVPAIESVLTPADFRDGIDRELMDAIAWLETQ